MFGILCFMQWEEFRFNVRHLGDADQAAVQRAFEMGMRAHEGQKRKSGEPYFTHPIAVARILADLGGDRDTVVAGLLHDTVEDTPVTLQDIEREFGEGVAQLIDGVTKLEGTDVGNKPGIDEQIETLRKMFTLMQEDVRIMVIKLADRLHNMQTIGFRSPESQVRIARDTMDVYVKIADRLCMRDLQNTLESLCMGVLEPELFKKLQDIRAKRETTGREIVNSIERTIRGKHAKETDGIEIAYEQKSWYRLREQIENGGRATGIATVAIGFVCADADQCYRVLGALHREWQREILSFQDFINSPMINGYQALHTTVILEDGTRVRCKIRTKDMQAYAHRGITLYCFDSRAKGPLEYLPWTKRIAAIASDTEDRSDEFWEGLQSDILGSTRTVHGPDDRTVMLPVDATVLDGAFYLFGDLALRVTELYVNGRAVPFDQQLDNAATVSAAFSPEPVAGLRWLHSVHTAMASAIIRKQLSEAPREEKIAVGHELFDVALRRAMHLQYDEIEPSLFASRIARLGVESTDDLFEDIAEGKVDAAQAATELFSDFRTNETRNASSWILRANVPSELEGRVIRAARGFDATRVSTRAIPEGSRVVIRLNMNREQADALDAILRAFLQPETWTMRKAASSRYFVASVTLLLVLWGLDPVVARSLLTNGMSAYDLTFVRAVTFFVASFVLYGTQLAMYGRRLKWLSPRHPTLLFSGIAMFATALLSYVALSGIAATAYIFCIIAGLLATTLLREIAGKKRWNQTAGALFIIAAGVAAATYALGFTERTLLAGVGSGLAFSLYSELSRRYQVRVEAIRARYPAFLFWMSCVGIVLSGFIFPFTRFDSLDSMLLLSAAVFSLGFSVIPYGLYFEITRRMESPLVDRSLPLVAVIAVVGELLLTNSIAPLITLPVLLFFLAYYYGMHGKKAVTAS